LPEDRKKTIGNRLQCQECGTKYYDLNRPAPVCPKCQTPYMPSERPKFKVQKPVEIEIEAPEEPEAPSEDLDILSFDSLEEDYQEFNSETSPE
jgi:hypothetical protein